MVDLAPFRGLRFDPRRVGADLAALTAPPYDAIDGAEQRRLLERHDLNVVRLELPREEPDDLDDPSSRYARAARCHRAWRADGTLTRDASPALYAYEQTFDGRRQVGLIAALRLVPWERGQVLPHEAVMPGPVADRRALLDALPLNVSPVFLLAPDTPADVAQVLDSARAGRAQVDFTDDARVRHRLWTVTNGRAHTTVARAYGDVALLMADGHHRYTAALEHHQERPGPGTDRIMAYVVGADRGPVIDPTHRLVRNLSDDALSRLSALGSMSPADGEPQEVAASLDRAPRGTFGIVTSDRTLRFTTDRQRVRHLLADVAAPVDQLDITLLQALLLDVLDVPDRVEHLRYTSDLVGAVQAVRDGAFDALFLVRPVSFDQFRAACEAGVRMPPKSTAFRPKPRTGLVMRPLVRDDGSDP